MILFECPFTLTSGPLSERGVDGVGGVGVGPGEVPNLGRSKSIPLSL